MKQYKGMGRVFSFTLIQQVRQKGWRTTTLLLALACLIIPIVSLTAAAQHQKNAAGQQGSRQQQAMIGTECEAATVRHDQADKRNDADRDDDQSRIVDKQIQENLRLHKPIVRHDADDIECEKQQNCHKKGEVLRSHRFID